MKYFIILVLTFQSLSVFAQQWEEEFAKFDSLDDKLTQYSNPILFTGSSSVRFWVDIKTDLNNGRVLNRGFGGSEFFDLIENFERVIGKYKPKKLFIYSGDNDIANGKSAIKTFADFCALYGMIKATLPNTEVFIISIKPSPSRWDVEEEMVKANRLIKEFCEANVGISFIDVWNPMIGNNSKPIPELFIRDSLHMSRAGYKLWTDIISKKLD